MPNRDTEVQHLALADRHIADAQRLMAHLAELIARAEASGADSTQASGALAAMDEVMATFHVHRAFIVQTIADIDAGKL